MILNKLQSQRKVRMLTAIVIQQNYAKSLYYAKKLCKEFVLRKKIIKLLFILTVVYSFSLDIRRRADGQLIIKRCGSVSTKYIKVSTGRLWSMFMSLSIVEQLLFIRKFYVSCTFE